ncbi:YihY family inner membrane protein [Pelomonas sp. KK5]|uniref:YihY family inner membrane protein n=1 Tax=Pelomonas sp. KK5 TaxID=1855730 RepID=UPI00097BED02|nr:YihY family inner membrane protein [Pelomonas sp. KK5]
MTDSLSDARLAARALLADFRSALRAWPWRHTLLNFRKRFREDRLGLTAGSLTFTTLISLVPLLTVMLALFTAFPIFSSFQASLQKYFLASLIPDTIARPVLGALTQFSAKANRLGAVGLVALGGTALALMLTIDRTLNAIWRVQRPRPIAQRVLVYWAALTLGPLLLGGSLTLTSYAVSAGEGLVKGFSDNIAFLLRLLETVLMGLGMAGLFHYVPNTHVRWRHALLGGAFVAIAFGLAKAGLAWYVKHVPTYSTLYGAFATVPILLIWMYLGWVIVLLGAVLAANAPMMSRGIVHRPDVPGLELELALEIIGELAHSQARGEGGLGNLALAQRLRADPLQLEPVIDRLLSLDWLGRLDESGVQRLVLLCVPEQTPAAPLLRAMLAERHAALQPLWQRSDWDRVSLKDLLRVDHHQ